MEQHYKNIGLPEGAKQKRGQASHAFFNAALQNFDHMKQDALIAVVRTCPTECSTAFAHKMVEKIKAYQPLREIEYDEQFRRTALYKQQRGDLRVIEEILDSAPTTFSLFRDAFAAKASCLDEKLLRKLIVSDGSHSTTANVFAEQSMEHIDKLSPEVFNVLYDTVGAEVQKRMIDKAAEKIRRSPYTQTQTWLFWNGLGFILKEYDRDFILQMLHTNQDLKPRFIQELAPYLGSTPVSVIEAVVGENTEFATQCIEGYAKRFYDRAGDKYAWVVSSRCPGTLDYLLARANVESRHQLACAVAKIMPSAKGKEPANEGINLLWEKICHFYPTAPQLISA